MNVEHIQNCFENANKRVSKLTESVLSITGMSGSKNRHFLNNIFSLNGLSYLEVGCWRGSTSCSAMYNNNLSQCVLIDNFSEFGEDFLKIDKEWDNGVSIRNDLESNLSKFGCSNHQFIDANFFSVDLSVFNKFDVFFYDGCHDFEPQNEAIKYAFEHLNESFLFISDDYCFPVVRNAVDESLVKIKQKAKPLLEIKIEREEPINDNWWHGLYVGFFEKI